MDKWRFIDSGSCEPAYNMRLDQALADFYLQQKIPTLRLYRWLQPAISLGCFQEPDEVLDLSRCQRDNLVIIKRPTAGSAIYHSQDELTYSLVFSPDFIGISSVKESYQKITYFLIEAYRRIGLTASYAKDAQAVSLAGGGRAGFCFSQYQDYDILVLGKKLGGNAQKRKRGLIFQHGSIPFKLPDNLKDYFLGKEDIKNQYLSLSELGFFDIESFKNILVNSFQDSFGVKLIAEQLGPEEKNLKRDAKFS